ncbi:MAG: hypothetical protein EAZ42_06565 [Verrucomicrobia bacterium]|nr:MAG: hypothetical protein EAZ42_06565 [Verrucomicrobiota bacterium]
MPVKTAKTEQEWAREKQVTAQFGLSHMILFNLRKEGKIRSLSLRGEQKRYGARLFHLPSIREYLAKQEDLEKQQAKDDRLVEKLRRENFEGKGAKQ